MLHAGLLVLVGVALLAYAVAPRMRPWRRWPTDRPCASSSPPSPPGTAWTSTSPGGRRRASGRAAPAVVRALRPAGLHRVGRAAAAGAGRRRLLAAVVLVAVTAACVLLFPVAQVFFFGKTDYRRPADVVVVFGAQVHRDGAPSTSLNDRMTTAIELYKDHLVKQSPRLGRRGRERLQRGHRDARHGREGRSARPGRGRRLERRQHHATVADTVPFFGEDGWTRGPGRQPVLPPAAHQAGLPAGRLERVHGAGRHLDRRSRRRRTPWCARSRPSGCTTCGRSSADGRPARAPDRCRVTCSDPRWPTAAATPPPACTRSGSARPRRPRRPGSSRRSRRAGRSPPGARRRRAARP